MGFLFKRETHGGKWVKSWIKPCEVKVEHQRGKEQEKGLLRTQLGLEGKEKGENDSKNWLEALVQHRKP